MALLDRVFVEQPLHVRPRVERVCLPPLQRKRLAPLASLYEEYAREVVDMIAQNFSALSAAVYTQITDVETECNGLLTYDRLLKADPARIRAANEALIANATELLAASLR